MWRKTEDLTPYPLQGRVWGSESILPLSRRQPPGLGSHSGLSGSKPVALMGCNVCERSVGRPVQFQRKVSPPWLMAYLRSEAKLSGPWIFQKHSCLITVHLIRVIKSLRHWSCCCGKSQSEIRGLHLKGELGEHNAHWKANGRNQLMVSIIFKIDINCTNAFHFFKC